MQDTPVGKLTEVSLPELAAACNSLPDANQWMRDGGNTVIAISFPSVELDLKLSVPKLSDVRKITFIINGRVKGFRWLPYDPFMVKGVKDTAATLSSMPELSLHQLSTLYNAAPSATVWYEKYQDDASFPFMVSNDPVKFMGDTAEFLNGRCHIAFVAAPCVKGCEWELAESIIVK